ncbi:MAG: type VI secretion system tip protein VgrG [Sandaracinaceae bacterium]|nr:type VI secretion system tip protein VgrG [Sandaracinaceae bacterium]
MNDRLGAASNHQSTDAHRVRYSFLCETLADQYVVGALEGVEALDTPYRMTIGLEAAQPETDATELLGRDAVLVIERDAYQRYFHGVIARVTVHDHEHREASTVELVPALEALALTRDSRIFQDLSALDIVERVLGEGLAPYGRSIDATLLHRERYLIRDYCVQYGETSLDFVQRLLAEDGIGYYFQHDETGPETLVLFDESPRLSRAETLDSGAVRFEPVGRAWSGSEPIVGFETSVSVVASKVTVRDHDWARGRSRVEAEAGVDARASRHRHDHESYEHGFARASTIREDDEALATMVAALVRAALPHGTPAGMPFRVIDLPGAVVDGFTSNDASHQAGVRAQRVNRDAVTGHGVGLVCGFAPGTLFELVGHTTLGVDGEYLLTRVTHSSTPMSGSEHAGGSTTVEGANYSNRFDCIPRAVPWRPARRAPKPRIYGVQTATVTGPMGMDVHTDQHGRIKVRFPWDRAPEDVSGNHTCWLRVAQTWAGSGAPGFVFIPRVGMEVVVSFVDGVQMHQFCGTAWTGRVR